MNSDFERRGHQDWTALHITREGILSFFLLLILSLPVEANWLDKRIQLDLQGTGTYSRFNFTDIKRPYDGGDAWAEFKLSYWFDEDKKNFGPFVTFLPSATTEHEFPWQRYVQVGGGFQWYLFAGDYFRAIRLFASGLHREFYDQDSDFRPQTDVDVQIGADYYYDNLFTTKNYQMTFSWWTNAGYRHTNFASDDYDTFLWTGNIKIGPKVEVGQGFVIPYALADWTWVPRYDQRFWENFLRLGGGIRWYPKTPKPDPGIGRGRQFINEFIRRFFLFVEVQQNVAWLGDEPVRPVNDTDVRVGISFSTGGLFRDLL